ncbi:hypothetical protein T492DRAFT_625794 [Pavlovales sp. CCMP2436]|nr:hypothetical protein T492DRAFT_625794 [Pavlovales sp. CCMP2436]
MALMATELHPVQSPGTAMLSLFLAPGERLALELNNAGFNMHLSCSRTQNVHSVLRHVASKFAGLDAAALRLIPRRADGAHMPGSGWGISMGSGDGLTVGMLWLHLGSPERFEFVYDVEAPCNAQPSSAAPASPAAKRAGTDGATAARASAVGWRSMASELQPVHGLVVELEAGKVWVAQETLSPPARSEVPPYRRGCAHALCAIGGSAYCTLVGYPGVDAENPEDAELRTHGGESSYAGDLKSPKRLRVGGRSYACDEPGCDYAASGSSHLSKHKRMHSSHRPFPCDEPGCQYSAKQEGHLVEHKRTHTGERPYACDQPGCEYRSKQAGSLKSHKRTHTGERPYACEEPDCGYRAARACHLQKHKRTHSASGEQPYAHADEPKPEADADGDSDVEFMTVRESPLHG